MSDDIREQGMTTRREVLGDEHVDRATAGADSVHRGFPGPHHALRVGRCLVASGASIDARAAASPWRCWPRRARSTSLRCTCVRRCATASPSTSSRRSCSRSPCMPAFRARIGVQHRSRRARRRCTSERADVTDADRPATRARGSRHRHGFRAVARARTRGHPRLRRGASRAHAQRGRRAAGLTRASARRFLRTLAELGYVRSNGRLFALRPRVLELGYAYLSSLSLHEVAQPHLERLVSVLRESSSVSVLDADESSTSPGCRHAGS